MVSDLLVYDTASVFLLIFLQDDLGSGETLSFHVMNQGCRGPKVTNSLCLVNITTYKNVFLTLTCVMGVSCASLTVLCILTLSLYIVEYC